jgi:anti-anti-sigma factor
MRMLLDDVAVERDAHGTTVRLRHRFEPAEPRTSGPPAPAPDGCTIDVDGHVARVRGELDLACAPRALEELAAAAPTTIDLTGVTYLDSTGARMLLELGEAVPAPFAVVAAPGSVARRALDLSGLATVLDLRDA